MFFLVYYPCYLSRSISYIHSSTTLAGAGMSQLTYWTVGVRYSRNRGFDSPQVHKYFSLQSLWSPPPSTSSDTNHSLPSSTENKKVEVYLYVPIRLQDLSLKIRYRYCFISRDSSFGIATRQRAGRSTNRCSIGSRVKAGRPAPGITKPRNQWASVRLSPRLWRHRGEFKQLPSASAVVKKEQL